MRFAIAASVAAAVLIAGAIVISNSNAPELSAPVNRTVDAPVGLDLPEKSVAIAELLAESARLERVLVTFPRHDGVIRVSTAGTIAGLEDQIAWLDAELTTSAAFDSDPMYQELLWRERVEVMNALVDVHYAQVPARVLLP